MGGKTAEEVLRMIKRDSPIEARTMEEARGGFEAFYLRFRSELDTLSEPVSIDGIPAFWISTANASKDQVVLFFHGGGFTIGSTKDHLDLCGKISHASGCRVLSVDYRLAPEHIFPAALDDCTRSCQWLMEQGVSPSLIVPTGISAGGNLVVAMLMKLRDSGVPLPKTAVLLSPAVDLAFPKRPVVNGGVNDWLTAEGLDMLKKAYLRMHDPEDPFVSPTYGDLRGLPSLFIQAGTDEVLFEDIREFVRKAEASGVHVIFDTYDGMFHCWQIFSLLLDEGQKAIDSIGAYIRKTLQSA